MIKQPSRILQKRTQTSGATPTLPPSADHTDDTWNITDIYPGEIFWNMYDLEGYIGLTGGSGSFQFTTGGTPTPLTATTYPIINRFITIASTASTYTTEFDIFSNNRFFVPESSTDYFLIDEIISGGTSGSSIDITHIFQPINPANNTIFIGEIYGILTDMVTYSGKSF